MAVYILDCNDDETVKVTHNPDGTVEVVIDLSEHTFDQREIRITLPNDSATIDGAIELFVAGADLFAS